MISHSFNASKNRLDVVYTGIVTLDEIIDYIETVKNDASLPRKLKIFTVAKNIEMNFKHDDLHHIVTAVESSAARYKLMVDAFIVDKAKETAFSLLFGNKSQSDNYELKVFSTHEAAENWLNTI
ncbi:MAG: hypothetical protein JW729_04265 [Bacteroidales bacterium]|nr:hypothetical protein [Bacteroidales bacterium]